MTIKIRISTWNKHQPRTSVMPQPTKPIGKDHSSKKTARTPPSRLRRILTSLGPGLVTGASDDDHFPGIVTYSQAGSQFGLSTLWTALLTFPLMAAMQGMAYARIGLVTCQGLTGTLRQHYPKWVLYSMILFCFPAVILNIGADIQGMGAVANLLVPANPAFSFSIFFTAFLIYIIIRYPYQKMAAFLKWLCLGLLLYLIVPFLVHQDWKQVVSHAFIPEIHLNKDFLKASSSRSWAPPYLPCSLLLAGDHGSRRPATPYKKKAGYRRQKSVGEYAQRRQYWHVLFESCHVLRDPDRGQRPARQRVSKQIDTPWNRPPAP